MNRDDHRARRSPVENPQEETPDRPPTLEEIQVAIQELVAMGLVRDSGRRRNGKVVWVAVGPHPRRVN